ncbi:MAG: anti-sigma factor [Phenylobacterium sp.]|nr:anti-sigma factor [Phenylobacterium sp.]
MTSDVRELIIAYVDAELGPAERVAFEADMAADPALAADVARHQALAARVGATYAPVLDEPIPPQLLVVTAAANDRGGRPGVGRLLPWAAVAASLAVGVIAGRVVLPERGPLVARDGALVARGQLASALSTKLAADPGVVKVGLTLKTPDGRYCRTFQSAADHLAGLVCRQGGQWVARTVTAWTPSASPAYRTAGSDTPPEVLAAVDLLAGQPLDAAAERAARDNGWR